jgi:hypothetical protein
MIDGILLTVGIELCLFVTYLYFRAKKELKEEQEGKIYFIDEDLFI